MEHRRRRQEDRLLSWYCQSADFHLDKPRFLEVGVCYWPKKTVI